MAPEIMEILQKSLDWIEEHLRAQIRPEELCAMAGFSLSHYSRLFEAATGLSIGRYLTRRRLVHAAYAMSRGTDAISAAMEYGFDTHAGFYKAFRREFGCAPSVYLRTHRAARPSPVRLKEETDVIDRKLVSRALCAWGLQNESVTGIYYANTGYRSDNALYIGGGYVLKCSKSLGLMHRQVRLMKALSAHGLGAPVIPAQDGREIVTEGDTDMILMPRLSGAPANAVGMMKEPETARAVGEGLARLHAALRECDSALCEEEDLVKTLREWAIPAAAKEIGLDETWTREYLSAFSALYPHLPVQIVHRDPNPDNMLMENGRVAAFLDLDLSRILPRIFDLAYASTGILVDAFGSLAPEERLAYFDAAKQIWQGYDEAAPLCDAERRALPLMVVAIELICIAAFAGTEKLRPMLEENKQMFRLISEHMDLF